MKLCGKLTDVGWRRYSHDMTTNSLLKMAHFFFWRTFFKSKSCDEPDTAVAVALSIKGDTLSLCFF